MKRQEALDLFHKSPLTFKFVSEPLEYTKYRSASAPNPISVASPIDIHFIEGRNDIVKREQATPSIAESGPIKTFTLWVKPSESSYNHKSNIRRNPIHGPWPEVKKSDHDFAYYALKEVVPDSIAQHGLCDWTTGGQLSEDVKLARADQGSGAIWQIRDRIERRRNREKANEDEHELTSWVSLKAALQPRDDDFTEAFASALDTNTKSINNLFGAKSSLETISEPLRLDSPKDQALDALQEHSEGRSVQIPEHDSQRNNGDSMAKSASKEILQKILRMPTSSNAASSSNTGVGSLRSGADDKDVVAQDRP